MTEPGTITPTDDGRYEVHGLTDSTIVAALALANVVSRRLRKAFGVAEAAKTRPQRAVRRKKAE